MYYLIDKTTNTAIMGSNYEHSIKEKMPEEGDYEISTTLIGFTLSPEFWNNSPSYIDKLQVEADRYAKLVTKYEAADGTLHDSEDDAIQHMKDKERRDLLLNLIGDDDIPVDWLLENRKVLLEILK